MRTRLIEWLEQRTITSGNRVRIKMRVLYGVQVRHGGQWQHACRGTQALIFADKERAQAERKRLRALPAA